MHLGLSPYQGLAWWFVNWDPSFTPHNKGLNLDGFHMDWGIQWSCNGLRGVPFWNYRQSHTTIDSASLDETERLSFHKTWGPGRCIKILQVYTSSFKGILLLIKQIKLDVAFDKIWYSPSYCPINCRGYISTLRSLDSNLCRIINNKKTNLTRSFAKTTADTGTFLVIESPWGYSILFLKVKCKLWTFKPFL